MDDGAFPRRRTEPLTAAELRNLWWAVPSLAVLLVANLLFELTGDGYGRLASLLAETATPTGDAAREAVHAAAALTWATLALVYLCAGAAAAIGSWRIVGERVRGRARRPFLLFAAGVTVLGLLNLAFADLTDAPMRDIYVVTRDALRASPAVGPARLAALTAVLTFINVMSVFVLALLFAAAAASALPPMAGWNEATLALRALQVRRFVALAAAFMVAGVLHMGAWTHWAGATLSAAADVALDEVAAAATIFWGATFTLMIAAFYVPVSMRLGELAKGIMDGESIAFADRQKWLHDRGLSFRWNEQLPQIAAMAAPLIAGPLSTHIGTFAEAVGR